jgi:diguanylate cyclase (GGDEF)-like protein
VDQPLESSPSQQGIALFDAAHNLIHFNPTFAQIWQLSPNWLQTQPSYEALLAKVLAQGYLTSDQQTQLQQALEQREVTELSLRVAQSNQACVAVRILAMPEAGRLLTLEEVTHQQQAEQQLTSEISRLTFLLNLAERLQVSENLREMGHFVLTYLVETMNAAFGDIKVIRGQGESRYAQTLLNQVTAEFIATYGEPATAELQKKIDQGISYGQGILWDVVQTGIAKYVENYATQPNAVPAFRHPDIGQLGIFPIPSASGQIIGVLTLESRTLQKLQEAPQQDLLLAACQMLGAAIERHQTRGALVRAEVAEAARRELEREVMERKQAEAQLRHNALHDQLTGLPNRTLFLDRLEHVIHLAQRRSNYLFAVLFLDFDRFKIVNDSLGHMIGDQLLIAFAQKLKSQVRIGDTVARLGGDEFTILLEDLSDPREATEVANRIQQGLALPFKVGGYEIFTTVSIGIALSSTGYEQPSSFLRDADIAMYRAKALGKARYEIFSQSMREQASSLLLLENDLRRAIDRQEFQLYYQPIVSLSTGALVGFEALIRWRHPEQGWLKPVKFIPIAEETGLIIPMGQWVLQEACRQMALWQADYSVPALTISVNISGKQFRQLDLIDQIRQILQKTGLVASRLKLEITETTLIENADAATAMLLELKALGIELHMDDFGTGYSSLSYLRRFPVDMLKIDRSFVRNISTDPENLAIIQTIVTLAQHQGITVTAEGIETEAEYAQLLALNCQFGQGYLFSRPVDSRGAEALIAREVAGATPVWDNLAPTATH